MTNEEAIKFGEMWLELMEDSKDSDTYEFFQIATLAIKQQSCKEPSIIPKKKTGWHIARGINQDRLFLCSCGFIKIMDIKMVEWNYCPVCGGTKMEVSE